MAKPGSFRFSTLPTQTMRSIQQQQRRFQRKKHCCLGLIGFVVVLCLLSTDTATAFGWGQNNRKRTIQPNEPQSIFVIRHGDRWDYTHPTWASSAERPSDPPLSVLGHEQARETGAFLDSLLSKEGFTSNRITWLSSPFLRTLQTSDCAIQAMTQLGSDIAILPEASIFEWDKPNKGWHNGLATLQERKNYFPRINADYQSLFVPELPENAETFLARCEKAMVRLQEAYPYSPRTALVLVTHAAGSVGLTKAATGLELNQIHPAGPCSLYWLTRTTPQQRQWKLQRGFNGHVGHLSDRGTLTTSPWNHFGEKDDAYNGYTGPPHLIHKRRRRRRRELHKTTTTTI